MVAANVGGGFVPLTCAREEVERRELVIVPVVDFHHERTLWAVRRRTTAHSRAAQAFLQVILEAAKNLFRREPHATRHTQNEDETGRQTPSFFTLFVSLLCYCQQLIQLEL